MLRSKLQLVLFAVPLAMLLSSCDEHQMAGGPIRHENVDVPAAGVERATLQLNLGAGELNIHGGSTKLISGDLAYQEPQKQPTVEVRTNGIHSAINIREGSSETRFRSGHIVWDLNLNDNVLFDIDLGCGAGQANIALGDVDLRSLKVAMGAGQVQLDLRGTPKHSYDAEIHGGVGQAVIHLPSGVGIWAEAHGGLGSIDVSGLQKKGDHYENDQYDKAKVNVHLKVDGGIGQIQIIG